MAEHNRVEDYFAGVLQGDVRKAFEHHLATCTVCQQRLKELRRLDDQLRKELPHTLPEAEPTPEWVKELVRRTIEEG